MSECDAKVRKILYAKENGTKKNEVPKYDSSQSGRKRAKDPNPYKRTPQVKNGKMLKKDLEFGFASCFRIKFQCFFVMRCY